MINGLYFKVSAITFAAIIIIKPLQMKKLLFSFLLAAGFSSAAFAQEEVELKPFKVDVSLGYAIPGGSGSKGGVLFAVEPKYAVMPNLAVGLRMEGAVVARFSGYDANGDIANADVNASASYLATGDYYFKDNYSFRPFAGAGVGLFSLAAANISATGGESAGTSSKFGGMVRAGLEAGHFRFGIEYNIVPSSMLDGFDANGNPAKIESKNSYLGIKLGVCIGGGRY